MRGPDQSVKQFNVTKRSLIATPVALMAIVSSCLIGLQLKAAAELRSLEQQAASLQQQYNSMTIQHQSEVTNKNNDIAALQAQIQLLNSERSLIDEKLAELQQLEKELQHFITTYGDEVPMQLDRNLEPTQSELQSSNYQFATMAYQARAPIGQMTSFIESLEQSMEQTLNQAKRIREQVDAYPNYWPTTTTFISSGYGYRKDPFTGKARFHAGIDIAGKRGDTIFSAADGQVLETGYDDEYGRYVIIEHSDELQTIYMHLDSIEAATGDDVVKGEKIGTMGSTGRSTGPHLHFQIVQQNTTVSPLPFLKNNKSISELSL